MITVTRSLVPRLWALCHVLRDDGITYQDYVTELTWLLFIKMAHETGQEKGLPSGYRWRDLEACDEVAAFWPRIQDATAGSYHARKQVRHYVENHSKRVGRFRENLDDEQLAAVEGVCGDLLRGLGYPVG